MEIPYEVTARRDTGLYNSKVGIWLFLASEVMLFGGLFSAYVFLRVGIDPAKGDIPWPVSVQDYRIGFINTLVLIASSVFVVLSWLALKERNWRKFQWWMSAVVACALAFLGLKSIEYTYKFTHHGIILKDGSVLEGVIKNKTDRIEFEAESVKLNLSGALPGFIGQLYEKVEDEKTGEVHLERRHIDDLALRGPDGNHSKTLEVKAIPDFKRWFYKHRSRVNRELAENRRFKRNGEDDKIYPVVSTAELTVVATDEEGKIRKDENGGEVAATFLFLANPRSLQAHTEESLSFKDAVTAKGVLKNDVVSFELHEVDLQMVPYETQEEAQAWELIEKVKGGKEEKKHWFEARAEALEPIAEWYEKRGRDVPREQKQSRVVSLHEIHLGGHGDGHHHGKDDGSGAHGKKADPGDAGSPESGEEAWVQVPRDQIKFMSNHGPRYHPYYAIYFTMTGLHGLHVIGGAIVLAYFLIFGKKLFLRNPEHMANRVEVGGLFWHFVDLVWIFLFPIMYLL